MHTSTLLSLLPLLALSSPFSAQVLAAPAPFTSITRSLPFPYLHARSAPGQALDLPPSLAQSRGSGLADTPEDVLGPAGADYTSESESGSMITMTATAPEAISTPTSNLAPIVTSPGAITPPRTASVAATAWQIDTIPLSLYASGAALSPFLPTLRSSAAAVPSLGAEQGTVENDGSHGDGDDVEAQANGDLAGQVSPTAAAVAAAHLDVEGDTDGDDGAGAGAGAVVGDSLIRPVAFAQPVSDSVPASEAGDGANMSSDGLGVAMAAITSMAGVITPVSASSSAAGAGIALMTASATGLIAGPTPTPTSPGDGTTIPSDELTLTAVITAISTTTGAAASASWSSSASISDPGSGLAANTFDSSSAITASAPATVTSFSFSASASATAVSVSDWSWSSPTGESSTTSDSTPTPTPTSAASVEVAPASASPSTITTDKEADNNKEKEKEQGKKIRYKHCADIRGTVTDITVSPCEGGKGTINDPCHFHAGSNYTITLTYVSPADSSQPRANLISRDKSVSSGSAYSPYPGQSFDGCQYTSCPIVGQNSSIYTYNFETLNTRFDQLTFNMTNGLEGESLMCAYFPVTFMPHVERRAMFSRLPFAGLGPRW